ncbi:MAG: Gfo/Idh/MocA family oxidoreductase [Armatimonadota bacterium]|nr:Gfo/Idh/MocA family oxidoreductase [Armatimonadota bacterium]
MIDETPVEASMNAIVVGVGGFGQVWWELNRTYPDIRVVAVVDPDTASLAAGGDALAIPTSARFATLEEALTNVPAHILLDSTPPRFHKEHALAAYEKGMHVFTAKPLADTWVAAAQMTAAADRDGLILGVNEQLRFGWLPLAVTHLLQTGEIGRVESIELNFREPSAWEGWRKAMDQPLLLDGAVQHFDMVRAVTGLEAESVFATAWRRETSVLSGPGSASAIFHLSGGVPFSYTGTWDHPREASDRTGWWGDWRIYGSQGEIRAEGNRGVWVNGVESAVVVEPLDVKRLSLVVLDQFIRTVRTAVAMPTDGWSDLGSLAMSEIAIRSADTGRPVSATELEPTPFAARNAPPLETVSQMGDNNSIIG